MMYNGYTREVVMTSRFGRSLFLLSVGFAFFLWAGCGSKEQERPNVPIGVNLVENGSFEGWRGDMPIGWKLELIEGEANNPMYFGRSMEEKNTGSCSYYMRGAYNTDGWYVLTQRIPIIPYNHITFSAAMMSKGLRALKGMQRLANVFLRFLDEDGNRLPNARPYGDVRLNPLSGTTNWSKSSETVRAPDNAYFVEIGLASTMTGWIYFDDIEVVMEEPIPWKIKKSKYVDYYYLDEKPLPDEAIEKETKLIESYAKRLGVDIIGKMKYFYYPDEESLKRILGGKTGHQRALWDRRELHTTEPYEDHIVVHLLLIKFGYPPFGLGEGIVYFLIGNLRGNEIHLSAKYHLVQLKIPPLYKMLNTEDIDPVLMDIALPAWVSFSTYLIDKYGMESFMELYKRSDAVTDEGDFNVIFKDIYGEDFPVVDRAWRLYVLRYEDGTEKKDSLQ
jgi:hypothetical protein